MTLSVIYYIYLTWLIIRMRVNGNFVRVLHIFGFDAGIEVFFLSTRGRGRLDLCCGCAAVALWRALFSILFLCTQ